ncbi:GNAT family N-acetyltransferase [Bacillus shivajii]|uniref:GNAT family N-acetyltransferase n=1 Tax=Bacillus shivajii TaxID=1983719 RepID=UPI001CFBC3D4|nr:GNAT family N-acetyltransferase [Bacillus shivajii]UCZ54240.1 GNAT family N-acetyltransferase [Bacillus shivajii]
MVRTCYLFGENPSLKEPSIEFAKKAGGRDAHIALLILHREGWEQYIPRYTDHWKSIGVKKITIIKQKENGELDVDWVVSVLKNTNGIFIGGGDTEKYHKYYSQPPIKKVIQEKYNLGTPIAGCSAGALLLPNHCILSESDTADRKRKILPGLALIGEIGISVHFTEWNDRKHIESSMKEVGLTKGYGIDEQACLRFDDERYAKGFGDAVHLLQVGKERAELPLQIREITNQLERSLICERILRLLPEWFGIEDALVNYINQVKEMKMLTVLYRDEVVGFITIQEETIETNEIHLIAVHPDYNQLGIGKMLIAEMEYDSILAGKKFLAVKTLSDKHGDPHYKNTRKFYESVGFVGVQELTELWGKENPCLVMVKNIR